LDYRWVSKTSRTKYLLIIAIFLIVALSGIFGSYFWYQNALQAVSSEVSEKTFIVSSGEKTDSILKRLEEQGIIRSAVAFRIYLRLTGLDGKLQAGEFVLSSHQKADEVAQILLKGRLDQRITIIEGLRIDEIAEKLRKELGINKNEFLLLAKEGYMFPDTYLIPKESSAADIVEQMRENFNKKVTPELKEDTKNKDLSTESIVILASIVEREAKDEAERDIIAGILIKRFSEGMPLQADATIQYALGFQPEENSWWKKSLTEQDLEIGSPYNTRKNKGLPPGPISNPGLESIKAAINPEKSPYYYYLHDKNGKVRYAVSLEGHNENINKYLR